MFTGVGSRVGNGVDCPVVFNGVGIVVGGRVGSCVGSGVGTRVG